MQLRLLRHATLLLTFGNRQLLVDPVLSPAGAGRPIPTTGRGSGRRNPLVGLPLAPGELPRLLAALDGILVTHLHVDHFDRAAQDLLPKGIPVLCQAEDVPRLARMGFTNLHDITEEIVWQGLKVERVKCCHGGPLVRRLMGVVSGFVLTAPGEPTLYLAGDTIWSSCVSDALTRYTPAVIVVNAGAAQLPVGRPITMDTWDVAEVCAYAPATKVVAVHLEAINHCALSRSELWAYLEARGLAARVSIPKDGETLTFA